MIKEVLGGIKILIIPIFILSGCSSKNENEMKKSFDTNIVRHTKLQKSEKIKLSQGKEVKVAITATYLNSRESLNDKEDKVKEKFIIGVYKSVDTTAMGLTSSEQNLTLNVMYPKTDKVLTRDEEHIRRRGYDALPITFQELASSDPLLTKVPFINSWSRYYFVEFPHTHRKKFSLIFQNSQFGTKKYQLDFTKSAKYLYFTKEEKEKYLLIK